MVSREDGWNIRSTSGRRRSSKQNSPPQRRGHRRHRPEFIPLLSVSHLARHMHVVGRIGKLASRSASLSTSDSLPIVLPIRHRSWLPAKRVSAPPTACQSVLLLCPVSGIVGYSCRILRTEKRASQVRSCRSARPRQDDLPTRMLPFIISARSDSGAGQPRLGCAKGRTRVRLVSSRCSKVRVASACFARMSAGGFPIMGGHLGAAICRSGV